jgi:hypothetical protein
MLLTLASVAATQERVKGHFIIRTPPAGLMGR